MAIYYILFFDEKQTKQDDSQPNLFFKKEINSIKPPP